MTGGCLWIDLIIYAGDDSYETRTGAGIIPFWCGIMTTGTAAINVPGGFVRIIVIIDISKLAF